MFSFVRGRVRKSMIGGFVVLLVMLVGVASASAQPVWRIDSVSNTTAQPGGTLTYYVQIVNVGTADSNGEEIKTTITLPAGVTGVSGTGVQPGFALIPDCTATDGSSPVTGQGTIQCATTTTIPNAAGGGNAGSVRYTIVTAVDPSVPVPSTVTASFNTTGGGASEAGTAIDPTRIDNPPGFGVDAFDGQILADQAGDPLTQAGGHPYAITTAIDFNTVANPLPLLGDLWPVEAVKDALVDLPPGLVGSVASVDQCTAAQLAHSLVSGSKPTCPPTSQVGTTLVRTNGFPNLPNTFGPIPVYNVVPPPDAPAQFGFNVNGTVVTLTARARSATDYGVSIDGSDIPEGLAIAGSSFTFWGVPSDPSHDNERACPGVNAPWAGGPTCPSGAPARAFLRTPTSCTAPAGSPVTDGLATDLSIDSWDHPAARDANGDAAAGDTRWQHATWVTHTAPGYPAPPPYGAHLLPTGCEKVPFTPALSLAPAGASHTSSPTPFTVDLSLPQSDDPAAIGEGDLKKAVVTLPAGVRISPSSADGLGACTPAQIGLGSVADPSCPDSSKVAAVTVTTPLLPQKLTGGVYLATPHDNPFGALIAIYIVVKGPGVNVKLAGRVEPDPVTGQVRTMFDDLPQLPFSLMHLEFNGGPRAPLTTPTACGTYTTHSVLTSWSGKTVTSDSDFKVDANSDGMPCSPLGFSPSFSAGMVDPTAGAFSPFTVSISRSDRDQDLNGIQVQTPPGLLGMLSRVALCGEPQAGQGMCSPVSQIGQTTVGAGAGPNPIFLPVAGQAPNPVYLTTGYKGAPFGLSVVVPAIAGPFNLGTVVVRSAVNVDRHTGQITISSDPLPQILEGIPLQVRTINVTVNRPGFMFNPTNCSAQAVSAQITSTQAVTVPLSSHFQVANCAVLPFHPSFSVSTAAKTSKANGASLHVHVATKGSPGSSSNEANIAKVNVSLPLALPSRLTTLQKACTSAQFESNPAGCPEGSFVGTATAHTPVLSSALTGPAILVSHGGVAFPDLVIVLQGEGIRLDLVGNTRIKNGITFSRFETVPDAPVSSFDLDLPRGPHSALTANRGLCGGSVRVKKRVTRRVHGHARRVLVRTSRRVPASLLMPTMITGQNGAVVQQTTKISVTGCTTPRALKKAIKKKAKRGRR